MKTILSIFFALCFIPGFAQIIPADRATTWNPGLNSVGGIPVRTTLFKGRTILPSGADDTKNIQNALDSCTDGQVVMLGPGKFNITGAGLDMNRSNITLRGSGPGKTLLVKPIGTNYAVINIGTRWVKFMKYAMLASNEAKGSYTVTLATNPGYVAGELVAVDQRPDPNFVNWGCHAIEGQGSRCWFGDCDATTDPTGRPLGQILEIASISGNTLTFTTPLHIDFKTALAARLAKMGDGDNVIPPVKYTGVEDLYVAYGEGGDGGGNISLYGAGYCWVKNVESDKSNGSNINMVSTLRCVLRDSYIHSTVNPTPGGAGYGINLGLYAADNLIENNISWNFNKIMLMRATGGGNVIGYNYMDDGWGAYYPTQPEAGLNASHYATSHFELFEGNESFSFSSESYWGNSAYITVFRNHLSGQRAARGFQDYKYIINAGTSNECTLYYEDDQTPHAVGISAGSWYYTFVGNVLGYSGMHINAGKSPCVGWPTAGYSYEMVNPGGDEQYFPMWRLDLNLDQLTGNTADENKSDTKVTSTLIRDGNFDFVTNTIKWDRTQQTIPNSLYLQAKPVFFGNASWPWVTPENAANPVQGILPAKARFDSIFSNTPPVITSISEGSHCSAGTIKLGATASNGTINWYAAPIGGTSLGTGLSYTTPNLTATKMYYVDATDNGKTTPIRTGIIAIIDPIPTITSATGAISANAGQLTLNAKASDGEIDWYDVATGGTSLGSGEVFTTPNLTSTKVYYVDATDYYGCTTKTRTAVLAKIGGTSVIDAVYDSSVKVFPNPTGGKTEIVFENDIEKYDIELFDYLGCLVQTHTKPKGADTFFLDLSMHPAGLYMIKLSSGTRVLFRRIIKN